MKTIQVYEIQELEQKVFDKVLARLAKEQLEHADYMEFVRDEMDEILKAAGFEGYMYSDGGGNGRRFLEFYDENGYHVETCPLLADIEQEFFKMLDAEEAWVTSKEYLIDHAQANEYLYTKDGVRV